MSGTRITYEERRVIEDLLDHGTEIKEIANIIHKSASAVSQEIKQAGGKRKYNAESAQKLSDERKKEGNKDKNSPMQHLVKRVLDLESRFSDLENKYNYLKKSIDGSIFQ